MVTRPIDLTGKFLQADRDIAAYEFGRSRSQQMHNQDWLALGIPLPSDGQETWDIAVSGEVTTPLFLSDPSARTATLGILRLHGDWDAADTMQAHIIGDESPLMSETYDSKVFASDDPEAKRRLTLDWGVTSVRGLTMVTRRRRLLRTDEFEEHIKIPATGRHYTAYTRMEVDKLSTFALDIEKLENIDQAAAQEVRLIIICGMLATRDLRRVYRATRGQDYSPNEKELRDDAIGIMTARMKMQHYGITADEVVDRLETENQTRIQNEGSLEAIEAEIKNRTGLLVPVTATFYGEREIQKLVSR
jgi:hypothetical protein